MILLWRPPEGMSDQHYSFWTHAWKTFAARRSESVMAATWDDTNVRRAWDTVTQLPGRMVIWARPEFIPSVGMFAELDYLLDQGIRLVVQQRYRVGFAPDNEQPASWESVGVDSSLLVFQLAGQRKYVLPSGGQDIWGWLEKERNWVYQVPQRFSGAHGRGAWASRSILGETVYSPFAQPAPGLPISRDVQLALWHKLFHAWTLWLNTTCSV